MKINYLIILLSIMFLSCDSDESGTVPQVPIAETPEISSLSTDFIVEGETLTIEGSNFINSNFQTTVTINDQEFDVNPISDSKISIDISNSMGIEKSNVYVKVSDKKSNQEFFFIVPKGWYNLGFDSGTFRKSFVFDDSNEIQSLVGDDYVLIRTISANSQGYNIESSNFNNNTSDLQMISNKIGAASIGYSNYFSTDGFKTANKFGNYLEEQEHIEIGVTDWVLYLNDKECITTNRMGAHFYTNDSGQTYSFSKSPNYMNPSFTGLIKSMGKGSDGYFYEIGYLNDGTNKRNLIRKSPDYKNWQVLDSTKQLTSDEFTSIFKSKFYDYNLLLSVNGSNQLVTSTDLAQNWTVVRDNVDNFFIENANTWYITDNDNLYVSEDAGATWNLELELPTDSKVNHMHFTTHKILVSGDNGLLYIKHR